MIRKYWMITTAIVALGAAPAVLAQSSTTQVTPPTSAQTPMPQKMSEQKAAPTKSPDKMIHKASLSGKHGQKAYREMNAREVEVTRNLNREAATGRFTTASAASTSPPMTTSNTVPMQGASLPQKISGDQAPQMDNR